MSAWPERWPRADVRAAAAGGALRTVPEDFEVTETLAFEPSGAGEHLYLFVEKRGITTGEAHRRLAAAFGVPRGDVSYAGMKDRHAVTRQWFSVRGPGDEADALGAELRVLRRARHARKLRRGELRSNRFRIRVRGVSGDVETQLRAGRPPRRAQLFRPPALRRRRGANVAAARQWAGAGRPPRPALHPRTAPVEPAQLPLQRGPWAAGRGRHLGDAACGRGHARGASRPGRSGGRGTPTSGGAALEIESATARAFPDVADTLEHAGLRQERRPLRVIPADVSWSLDEDVLTLECVLPKGVYATSVLREVGTFRDAPGAPAGGAARGARAAA